jgi:hypothetical protein
MTDKIFSLIAGIGAGATAMYVLDPEMGGRRRALARDKMTETRKKIRDAAGVTARDISNRSAGIMAEVRSRIAEREVGDQVLEGRVRSKLGFLVRHPSAIITQVSHGRVILSGPILSDEVQQLITGLHAVRGVTDVVNRLAVHDEPAQVSGLQGDKPKPAGEVWDIMQRHWSPSTRFLVGTAGAVYLGLIAYSLTDGGPRRTRASQGRAGTSWHI